MHTSLGDILQDSKLAGLGPDLETGSIAPPGDQSVLGGTGEGGGGLFSV